MTKTQKEVVEAIQKIENRVEQRLQALEVKMVRIESNLNPIKETF